MADSFHLQNTMQLMISPIYCLPLILLVFASTLLIQSISLFAIAETDPNDLSVLQGFFTTITENLPWDESITDPCLEDERWKGIFCTGSRVTQVQLKNMNLKGSLPSNFNQLSEVQQIGLQGNSLSGDLPSFNGLSKLINAYLTGQQFSTIPYDFFQGLSSLQTLSLQGNPLNNSQGGWNLPEDILSSSSLVNLDLTNSSLSGSIPEFLGNLTSLQTLRLSYNGLSGALPYSFSKLTQLSQLILNNNSPSGLSGTIDVIGTLPSLQTLWLQVNNFNGTIPESVATIVSLQDIRLNDNNFVGVIPWSFNGSTSMRTLMVQNNKLVGPLPFISNTTTANYTYNGPNNKFCQSEIGILCDSQLSALLSFMEYVDFPPSLTSSSWDGTNPCTLPGVACEGENVTAIIRPSAQLSGRISPYLGNLTYLRTLDLSNNNLTGTIPDSLTRLSFLVSIKLSNNNLYGPVPVFDSSVNLVVTGNPNIGTVLSPPPPPSSGSSSNSVGTPPPSGSPPSESPGAKRSNLSTIIGGVVGSFAVSLTLLLGFAVCKRRRKFRRVEIPPSAADSGDVSKSNVNGTRHDVLSISTSDNMENVHLLDTGNLVISIQVIRDITGNFSEENFLGKGGFGSVYKGELDDGTKIAVKKMESSLVTNKGLNEFHAEISVLTKVRHRHLVSLLGYCIDGDERILVYEYMPLGTLSDHLFERKKFEFPPLSWERRLNIALDVARGMEYLHGLARESFIHRDLKPSNILLGDDYRAKVSDFGLVKMAPGGGKFSIETRLAGTFGYLAPEYAVTGRVTTKADVFSFGVILMELVTGRKALDENQPEESMHLVTWFRRQILVNKVENIFNFIDPTLQLNDETSKSLLVVTELAGHCTSREAQNRPDMGYVVNVLSSLVQQWKPKANLEEDEESIDLDMSLPQILKKWQAYEGNSMSYSDYMNDNTTSSLASIPPRPSGLAHTFDSADGR